MTPVSSPVWMLVPCARERAAPPLYALQIAAQLGLGLQPPPRQESSGGDPSASVGAGTAGHAHWHVRAPHSCPVALELVPRAGPSPPNSGAPGRFHRSCRLRAFVPACAQGESCAGHPLAPPHRPSSPHTAPVRPLAHLYLPATMTSVADALGAGAGCAAGCCCAGVAMAPARCSRLPQADECGAARRAQRPYNQRLRGGAIVTMVVCAAPGSPGDGTTGPPERVDHGVRRRLEQRLRNPLRPQQRLSRSPPCSLLHGAPCSLRQRVMRHRRLAILTEAARPSAVEGLLSRTCRKVVWPRRADLGRWPPDVSRRHDHDVRAARASSNAGVALAAWRRQHIRGAMLGYMAQSFGQMAFLRYM